MRLSGASYSYEGSSVALDRVDMSVAEGECVAIIGPNGAGKSTLLKIMAGLLEPASGTVEIAGKPLTKNNAGELRRDIGILFQDPDDQLFMPSVREDVAFGPLNQGLGPEEAKMRVAEALKIVGLAGFEERVPHHLSYGEKKRVAIAGILAMRPKMLLLDEPTANLDPRGRAELMELIQKLKCTVVMATHDMAAVAAMADRIYVLDRKVLAAGSKRDILTDGKLLGSAGLEMPAIAKYFSGLQAAGKFTGEIPMTVEEAVAGERKNA